MNDQDFRDLKESNLFGVVRKKISQLYYICIIQNMAIASLASYYESNFSFVITVGIACLISFFLYGKNKHDFDKV